MTLDELVRVLRSYNVPYDRTALKAVFDDPEQGPALKEWTRVHLTPDTLLSEDQLTSYLLLERSGNLTALEKSVQVAPVHPLGSDQEVKDAIEQLDRSTKAISRQIETMRQQREALARLVTSSGRDSGSRTRLEVERLTEWETDRKTLSSIVESLSQNLAFRISDLDQQKKGLGNGLHQAVDGAFQSDDKLLASLQKLGWELQMEDPDERESVARLREVCARLIKYTVETVRTRLDRLYLESLEAYQRSGSHDQVPTDEVTALQEELESLYSEVLPVAQMSVEQQHLEPALKSLAAKDGQNLNRSAEAVNYIHECLDYLLDHMERLSSHVEEFKAHEAATATLVGTAKSEVAAAIESASTEKPRRGTVTSSPSRRRSKSSVLGNAVSPVRQRAFSTPQRRSLGTSQDSPLEQLLRDFALILPEEEDMVTGPSDEARIAFFSKTLEERAAKAADVERNVQESFESSAIAHVADARHALQIVRDSVLEESPFGDVKLVDPEIEGSVVVLAQEVENVRRRLEASERDIASVLKGRNLKKEEFIGRWGR
ncbi:Vacuolar H+/Ca2+ exchanger [Pleurostoma richardsiae]|uniref:Vacuolar H+/Ca2+ exchanger n=1 Tax=Pleurostoma richardsiae TaxID=41990 RepID=A0AA38VN54_9PEZI|nr:Vacuolar H+/Ca2+ exchanger [Pleurostoma richardsiae]